MQVFKIRYKKIKITTPPTITYKILLRFRQTNSSKATQDNGNQAKTISAFDRIAGKRHCDERKSGAMAAAVKKRNCLRRVRRPKASEADYKAEFFVLGQGQAQQRRATSLLLAARAKAKSDERKSKAQQRRATSLLLAIRAIAKSDERKAKPFARNPSEGEKRKSKAKRECEISSHEKKNGSIV